MRLVPAAVVAWAAAMLVTLHPGTSAPLAIVLWCVVLVLLLLAVLGRRRRWSAPAATIAVALAAAALVSSTVWGTAAVRSPPVLVGAEGPLHGAAVIEVASFVEPRRSPGWTDEGGIGIRFDATLLSFARGGSLTTATMPVLAFASVDDPDALRIGERLRFDATLLPADDGSGRQPLLLADGRLERVADPPWWLGWADGVRRSFRGVAAALPGDGGALLPGLVVGDDTSLPADVEAAMLDTGLTHLTAVSGANCALVVAMGVLVAAALGAGLRVRLLVGALLLGCFVIVVTPQPSVVRAAAMAVVVLLATASGRARRGVPALALAVVVLLVTDPSLALSAGFALSTVATAGLLLLSPPVARLLDRVMPSRLAAVLAVPVAAQLACQPLLVVLDPVVPLYSVPANLLAEPAAGLTTITGSVVCVLAATWPGAAAVLAWVPWLGSAWIAAVARFLSGLPGAVLRPGGDPLVVFGLVTVCCLGAMVGLLLLARRRRWGIGTLAGAAAVVILAGAVLTGRSVAIAVARPADWQVAACDIGQGDALVLRSAGRTMLIDTGPDPEPLVRCLETLAIDHLDVLVLTHYDLDHVGGAEAVVGLAATVLVGPDPSGRGIRLRESLRRAGATIVQAGRGLHGDLGDYRWDVVWPPVDTHAEGNDASVTLLLTGPLRMLFLGDLGENAQDALLDAGPLPALDVVKVAHHGSADQSERLYRVVHAVVGLVSVGVDNDYGHPTSRLLQILDRAGTTALRTDLGGLVLVGPAPGGVRCWSERSPPDSVGGGG